MNRCLFKFLSLLFIAVTFSSCEKYNGVDEDFENKEANSTLVIRTRAAQVVGAESEAKVSYPVNVYVFDDADRCVAVMAITSDADELSLNLPEGGYDVYAVAGADAGAYDLPTKENATKESVVALKDGHGHGDIMTANNTVTLAYGEENKLTLTLERKVMMIETVTINNVPSNVTAVSVSVSPLYENILLNGSYSGERGEYTVNLTEEGESNIWKNEDVAYLLEAVGTATVKVSFTAGDKIHSYSYLCPEELKANYKVNISGTYTEDDIKMTGSITGATWEGTKNVTFEFNESGSSETTVVPDDGEDDSGQPVVSEDAPKVGDLYKNCYVLRVVPQGAETVVTLMSPTEIAPDGLNITSYDQEYLKTAVEDRVPELAVDGVDGWRLATTDEMAYVHNNLNDIQNNITALNKKYGGKVITMLIASRRCFYNSGSGISIYGPNVGNIEVPNEETNFSNCYLRAFATVTFKN